MIAWRMIPELSKREVSEQHTFSGAETFGALNMAQSWLDDEGYSYGPPSRDHIIAVYHDDSIVSKWYNLSSEDKEAVDGVIVGDLRDGSVRVVLFKKKEAM